VNGPEHYREAERLIAHARACTEGVAPEDCDTYEEYSALLEVARQDAQMDLAAAQVHATLALAAASTPVSPNAYRCIECGAMAGTRGEHLPTCSVYVAPWAGTVPGDASSITDVTQ
jgi:hypothetical protein